MVFTRKVNGIIVVHNDVVYGIDADGAHEGRCALQVPLEQVLNDASVADKFCNGHKGKYQNLCILPDHWFGIETYPFRSKRAKLIESYLERRLAAAYPDLADITQFFNYTPLAQNSQDNGILACFLQDQKAYAFYNALRGFGLTPGWITSPGFLWTEALSKWVDGFDQAGTLLIHMSNNECLLYFFFNGQYLFSRSVVLSDMDDSLNAVAFEINQSLYLFSQKTKNELSRFLLLTDRDIDRTSLGEALGRDIIPLNELLPLDNTLTINELPFLHGLLRPKDLHQQAEFFSITHRQVKHCLAWRPVQWSGIVIGGLLLILIAGNIFLDHLLNKEADTSRAMRLNSQMDHIGMLSEHEAALNRVLSQAERPGAVDTIGRLIAALPDTIWIASLDLAFEGQMVVIMDGIVAVEQVDQLKLILTRLVDRINADFSLARELSFQDIDIRSNTSGLIGHSSGFGITIRMELV